MNSLHTVAVVGSFADERQLAVEVARQLAEPGARVVRVDRSAAEPRHTLPAAIKAAAGGSVDVLVHVVDDAAHSLPVAFDHTAGLVAAVDGTRVVVIVADTRPAKTGDWPVHGGPAALRAGIERLAADRSGVGIQINAVAVTGPVGPIDRIDAAVGSAVVYLAGSGAALVTGQCLTVDAALAAASPVSPAALVPPPVGDRLGGEAVVVVGMGVALPGVSSPEDLWALLRGDRAVFGEPGERVDLDTIWSPDRDMPDRTYTRISGFIPPAPSAGGPVEDFTANWLRHCVRQATEKVLIRETDRHLFAVGLTPDGSHHLEQSLVMREVRRLLGEVDGETRQLLHEVYPLAVDDPEHMLPFRIARRVAAELPDDTEIVILDTACSSSLYGIDMGARALRAGEADVALCGGAFALNVENLVLFAKLSGLSSSGNVRPLDRAADGVLFTDGAAVLVLKTLARARSDGDEVLGFVAGFGGSADGRGKAIYAPNPAGQRIALRRAWLAAGVKPADIDWVNAHATGTPVGDRVELSVLSELAGPDKRWTLTANKSLIGHTAWAAGAVSAIHALLALRHELIPAQRHFTELPDGVDTSIFSVPTQDLEWPARDTPRTVAVSAMGFGGTNSHLLLTDTAPNLPAVKPGPPEPVVVTAWAAHLPGSPDRDRVRRWLLGGPADWPTRFDDDPLPSPVELRLTASAIATTDRSQLIAIRCADDLAGSWVRDPDLTERSGAFVGYTGPTGSSARHATRCYLENLVARMGGRIERFDQRVAQPVWAAFPAATKDSYPGIMPNIIAARLSQRLDLHGPTMALDAGLDSFAAALAAAIRSLRDGEIDLAMVIGVSAAADQLRPRDGREPAEAAVGIVVTRQSVAAAHELPELARVEIEPRAESPIESNAAPPTESNSALPTEASGEPAAGDRVHHGAEGGFALLRALHGPAGRTVLARQEDAHTPMIALTVEPDGAAQAVAPQTPALRQVMRRHLLDLLPTPAHRVRPALAAIPPGSVVVTDDADAVLGTGPRDGRIVVTPRQDPRDLAAVLSSAGWTSRHVRVILTGAAADPAAFADVLALNDLAFAAAQTCADSLGAGGSFAVLVLDGFDGAVPRPATGLFTGLARSIEQELPNCLTFALVTDSTDVAAGLTALAVESSHHRHLPVAYLRAGGRYELIPRPVDPIDPPDRLGIVANPVILATGGARGITAQLVKQLLTDGPPRGVWLLGTGPAPDLTGPTTMPDRPTALRELMARHPGEKIAFLNRRFEAAVREAQRVATILDLRRRVGADRVHYRQCDVRDAEQVAAVVNEILLVEGRVDVVVHGAGLVRSTALARKDLDDYRLVRDVKVLGDRNLRAALGAVKPALWCGISSVSAFIGMRGEADYQAGNEYLLMAAAAARAAGRDEVALVSSLWTESGMASDYAVGSQFTTGLADFTQLTDSQGVEFFRAELAGRGGPGLAATWLGDTEWSTIHRTAPDLRERSRTLARPRPAFLTEPPCQDGATAVWRCEIGLERFGLLLDHLVDDRPTVPATVMIEIATEAAAHLVPGLVPVRFTDIVLSRFIRAPRSRWPRPIEVTATQYADTVRVTLASPASGPVPAFEHARMAVSLATAPDPVARIAQPHPPGTGSGTVPDVYQLGGSLRLSGVFAGMHAAQLHHDGGSALFRLPADDQLDGFLTPSVAFDALLRASVLDGCRPDSITMMVPTAIREINIHAAGNDLELRRRWGADITLRHYSDAAGGPGRCLATAHDGTVLFGIDGISGSPRETYDLISGRWLDRSDLHESTLAD